MDAPFPVETALPALRDALAGLGVAVLEAPPGAGKTTRVPLALMGLTPGRILMLEPRRLAARAAAARMASTLGQPVGRDVGYRMRGDSRPGARIEVITEGLLTRMIQADPDLPGVGLVIFDEVHERSLAGDLGLALALEARVALRPDLRLLAMSATLDAAPFAALMGRDLQTAAPVVRAEGRAFPVETRWLPRPLGETRLEVAVAAAVREAAEAGDVLAFLPGEAEIRRAAGLLAGFDVRPLYSALPAAEQARAFAPASDRPKVVLATNVAETSLTIPGIRAVVDGGRVRRARFDPGSGMGRLVTERVSRAEADQRRGRAGREAPGLCLRLWTRGEEGGLAPNAPPEMLRADLAPLALELAVWGSGDLPFLTLPPAAALDRARDLLRDLSALDGAGRVTADGRRMAAMGVHPRIGRLLLGGGDPRLAAALSEGTRPRDGVDLESALGEPALGREAKRLARLGASTRVSAGEAAALAYPDRIARRRAGEAPRYLLSGGRGAVLPATDPLARAEWLVVTDLDGAGEEARIRAAVHVTEDDVVAALGDRIVTETRAEWSPRDGRVRATETRRLGALVLSERPWDAPPDALRAAALDGLRALGLPLSPAACRLMARAAAARATGADLPDLSEATLLATLDEWAPEAVGAARTEAQLRALDLVPALRDILGPHGLHLLDRVAPSAFVSPLGRSVPIDWDAETPTAEARLPELYGLDRHPMSGDRPLRLQLLSPGGKPVAVTTDLPGFWRGGYAEVRREMRGRYPRHPWPDEPWLAAPTTRAKPRGS